MQIKGWQKTSLIDYPNKVCSVIFLEKCNFHCPYCYNPDLVINFNLPLISEKEVLDHLKSKKGLIDGICITGGEPTIHPELIDFIKKIKELGFLVKLDTNGSNPTILKKLIKNNLLDFIAMDIKAPLTKKEYLKMTHTNVLDKVKESIKIIIKSKIDYEFRTTLIPSIHTEESLKQICNYIKKAKKYVLQNFKNDTKLIDPKLQRISPFSKEEMNKFLSICKEIIPNIELR